MFGTLLNIGALQYPPQQQIHHIYLQAGLFSCLIPPLMTLLLGEGAAHSIGHVLCEALVSRAFVVPVCLRNLQLFLGCVASGSLLQIRAPGIVLCPVSNELSVFRRRHWFLHLLQLSLGYSHQLVKLS